MDSVSHNIVGGSGGAGGPPNPKNNLQNQPPISHSGAGSSRPFPDTVAQFHNQLAANTQSRTFSVSDTLVLMFKERPVQNRDGTNVTFTVTHVDQETGAFTGTVNLENIARRDMRELQTNPRYTIGNNTVSVATRDLLRFPNLSSQEERSVRRQRMEKSRDVGSAGPVVTTLLWSTESFKTEANKHDWCKGLGDQQTRALTHFMNTASVRKFDDIGQALSVAISAGRRLAFEAACAVYESGVVEINEQDDEGKTCLHKMTEVRELTAQESALCDIDPTTGKPPLPLDLSERFARTIKLGADPFLADNSGKTAMDLAAQKGCLRQLLLGMSKGLPTQHVDSVLGWKDDQKRNILSHAAGMDGEAMVAVRMIAVRKEFGEFNPKITFQSELSEIDRADLHAKINADWDGKLNGKQIAAVARFMEVMQLTAASPQEVAEALPLALTTGFRPAFEAAWSVYDSGVCDTNDRNDDGHTCLHDLSLGQEASGGLWGYENASDKVEVMERLAVMLQLGSDPFSKGDNGRLTSAFELAQSRNCTELTTQLATLKNTLHELANERDGMRRGAIGHASSAEAVNFLCDLGISSLGRYEKLTTSTAIGQWLRRNPHKLMDLDSLGPYVLKGAPAEVITACFDAFRAWDQYDVDGYQGDMLTRVRVVLDWSMNLNDLQSGNLTQSVTLFNCSASTESAATLLKERMGVRSGNLTVWENWCDKEWSYLVNNQDIKHQLQKVSSIELAKVLLDHRVYPSNKFLSSTSSRRQWEQLQTKVTDYRDATRLWEQIQKNERGFDSLSKAEWKLVATHAYRVIPHLAGNQCKEYCLQLGEHLMSLSKCDKDTRIAFLKTAYDGKQALGNASEFAEHRKKWDTLVGRAGYAFRYRENGSLSGAGMQGTLRDYVTECSNDVARKIRRG